MTPFVVFSLPRSRSAWLSRLLTYGEWVCGHEELRHMRSLDDVRAWFSQPYIGTCETAAAPWWRLLEQVAPGARVVVVRRPVDEVIASLMNLPKVVFDPAILAREIHHMDRKLGQITRRLPGVLSVRFEELSREDACAEVFEHCLPDYAHDHAHWKALSGQNIQIDMRALMRHFVAFRPALEKLASIAKHQTLAAMTLRPMREPEGITFQAETLDSWIADGRSLFEEHCIRVGEAPDDWRAKNIPLMRRISENGGMQILSARSNGRMFGYLVSVIAPSLTSESVTSAVHTTFFAAPEFPGLGRKLQRAAVIALKERGIDEAFMQTGVRGDGARMGALYRRMGAERQGEMYRIDLRGA